MSLRTGLSHNSKSQKQSQFPSSMHQTNSQKKKLLNELQNELFCLDQIQESVEEANTQSYLDDSTLSRLHSIRKQAASQDLAEIQNLCKLAMGRRILNIELGKKKAQQNQKTIKKRQLKMFFRQNRVKAYDYQDLIAQKLKQSTFIARAYENGKGFIESDRQYSQKYERALLECQYMNTIRQVNHIFYKNYSGNIRQQQSISQLAMKCIWAPILAVIVMAFTFPFMSFLFEEGLIILLLSVILLVLIVVAVKTFVSRPNSNNQMQQSKEDVRCYFEQLNKEFQQAGRDIVWRFHQDFLYLQVTFHDGFPAERTNCFQGQ